jgi:hypothetical protein
MTSALAAIALITPVIMIAILIVGCRQQEAKLRRQRDEDF